MKLNSLFLVLLICTLFFTTKSFAQIEDIKVGTSNRKMLVYAPPQIEEDRPLLPGRPKVMICRYLWKQDAKR